MLEIINETPALLFAVTLIPAIILAVLVYVILNKRWNSKYNELDDYYKQSQLDNKNLREELNTEKENLVNSHKVNEQLKTKIGELEIEIEEEIRDKNEQLSKFEVRLDGMEVSLNNERERYAALKEKEAKKGLLSKAEDTISTITGDNNNEKTEGGSLRKSLTGIWKKLTASDIAEDIINEDSEDIDKPK